MIGSVVGLDISLRRSGASIFYPDGSFMTKGISVDPSLDYPIRLRAMVRGIFNCVAPGDRVFIESYAFSANMNSLTVLAEVTGIIKYVIWNFQKTWPVAIPPSTIKKWTTGKGNAKKEDIKLALYKKYGLEFETSDEADAYALGDLGWHLVYPDRPRRKLIGVERDILQKIVKDQSKQ